LLHALELVIQLREQVLIDEFQGGLGFDWGIIVVVIILMEDEGKL